MFINLKKITCLSIELGIGESLVVNEDGSAKVTRKYTEEEILKNKELFRGKPKEVIEPKSISKLIIAKPWAKDANGVDLKTSYSVIGGNTLRQKIDLKNAVFPVVADPIYCGDAVWYTSWIIREGKWTDSVYPTWCGRYSTYDFWNLWIEAVDKTVSCTRYSGNTCIERPWNKQYGTSVYWSMYDQLACHWLDWRAFAFKSEWNIEPWRPNVGIQATRNASCNPYDY
jgi:hypothetical protein